MLLFACFYLFPLLALAANLPRIFDALGAGPSVWMLLAQFGALTVSVRAFALVRQAVRLSWMFGSMLTWGEWSWTAVRGYGWQSFYEATDLTTRWAFNLGLLRLRAGEVLNEVGVNVPVGALIICLVFFLERRRVQRSMQRAAL
ncbi:hypothetical protein [Hydrogenophaga sp. PAMC20947]|uniref:hypothetical protein n=1 Tax=Hydrogenophaga sp. PAMC20947 TaxID=2565558 RepID=UPI00109DAD26|nr:hypothetical protein [Hydrogenophaga sp. PAMC20947]QCB45976.1 hypothetical protein E5678_08070 [Hydrogenophaga sp. PAMC20947]